MEAAPIKEIIADQGGFASRLWIRWFQSVQKVLGSTEIETIRIIASNSPYTIADGGVNLVCNTNAGAITVLYPVGVQGAAVRVVNVGTLGHAVTINGSGVNISGAATQNLSDGQISETRFDSIEGWN